MAIIVKGGGGKPEEEKTVTAGTSVIEVNPSSGKVMKKVTVNPTPTESKSVTPTTSELTVTPSVGKHLSQVVVGAMEDVTPEVTAQTPVITQIAENLGVTITTPSGTNKQILQGNNANLLNIKNNAKKEGLYVWKKLTAEGGDFVEFAVNNNLTAYPDGGEQDGYWYEKVKGFEGFLECDFSKVAVDKFTFTEHTLVNQAISHSLGERPKFAIIIANQKPTGARTNAVYTLVSALNSNSDTGGVGVFLYFVRSLSPSSIPSLQCYHCVSNISVNRSDYFYEAGIEYTLITMA